MPICSQGVITSARRFAKAEVRGANPRESTISLPLCLSSYRSGFVNRNSSVRVRPGDPFHGDHDVTAASRPVTAFVPVQIRLVTPISEFESGQQPFRLLAGKVLRMGWFNRGSIPHVG